MIATRRPRISPRWNRSVPRAGERPHRNVRWPTSQSRAALPIPGSGNISRQGACKPRLFASQCPLTRSRVVPMVRRL